MNQQVLNGELCEKRREIKSLWFFRIFNQMQTCGMLSRQREILSALRREVRENM
jgi:hypothetical protein